jgi:predicted nucleic acid-binding Zn ribbon protein
VNLARAALAAARADARARGIRPTTPPRSPAQAAVPSGRADLAEGPVESAEPGSSAAAASDQGFAAGPDRMASDGEVSGPVPGMGTAQKTPARGRRATNRSAGASVARPGFPVQPRRADPQPLGAAINGLLDDEGWGLAAATGSVFGRWAQIVGSDLAAHTTPDSLSDGELTVTADSTAWATQVRLLAAQLVSRLNRELGDGSVRRVRVRGPVTSTRKPGEWRVRGGRGPRDTYG